VNRGLKTAPSHPAGLMLQWESENRRRGRRCNMAIKTGPAHNGPAYRRVGTGRTSAPPGSDVGKDSGKKPNRVNIE
jgi:hypothetical protein